MKTLCVAVLLAIFSASQSYNIQRRTHGDGHGPESGEEHGHGHHHEHILPPALTDEGFRNGLKPIKEEFQTLTYTMEMFLVALKHDTTPASELGYWEDKMAEMGGMAEDMGMKIHEVIGGLMGVFDGLQGDPSFKKSAHCHDTHDLLDEHINDHDKTIVGEEIKVAIYTDAMCLTNELSDIFDFKIPNEPVSERDVVHRITELLMRLGFFMEDAMYFHYAAHVLKMWYIHQQEEIAAGTAGTATGTSGTATGTSGTATGTSGTATGTGTGTGTSGTETGTSGTATGTGTGTSGTETGTSGTATGTGTGTSGTETGTSGTATGTSGTATGTSGTSGTASGSIPLTARALVNELLNALKNRHETNYRKLF